MRESFLHFIWQFQKFNKRNLKISRGEPIEIFAIGNYNTDAGPDFLNAKLLVGDITWVGHIELHVRSSDWNRHKHQHDPAYNNVILHVVWEHDQEVTTDKGQQLPVLQLKERIMPDLLAKCNTLIKSPEEIPCATQLHQIKRIDKLAMLDQVGVERLRQKSKGILEQLAKNKGDWEETTYQVLAKNFGFKTNENPFLKLAETVKHKYLVKHAHNYHQVEALIFGTAGFLSRTECEYQLEVANEFDFLSKKYKLQARIMYKAEWKFLRLRPGNFPTVRLAQFSAFVIKNAKCFDRFIHYKHVNELLTLFEFTPSSYWQRHYDFAKPSSRVLNGIGKASIDLILINTVAPLLVAYAQYSDRYDYMEKAIALLQSIKPEKNHIIKSWESLEWKAKDTFDTQSMIGLRNEFCLKKKCLSCKIGVSLINN